MSAAGRDETEDTEQDEQNSKADRKFCHVGGTPLWVCYQHSGFERRIFVHPFEASSGFWSDAAKEYPASMAGYLHTVKLALARRVVRMRVHHVVPGLLVALTEAVAIVCLQAGRNMRMTILIAIVDVGAAVFIVVLAGTFDAVVISLPLHFAELRWW